jgi:hypothetical protein
MHYGSVAGTVNNSSDRTNAIIIKQTCETIKEVKSKHLLLETKYKIYTHLVCNEQRAKTRNRTRTRIRTRTLTDHKFHAIYKFINFMSLNIKTLDCLLAVMKALNSI